MGSYFGNQIKLLYEVWQKDYKDFFSIDFCIPKNDLIQWHNKNSLELVIILLRDVLIQSKNTKYYANSTNDNFVRE